MTSGHYLSFSLCGELNIKWTHRFLYLNTWGRQLVVLFGKRVEPLELQPWGRTSLGMGFEGLYLHLTSGLELVILVPIWLQLEWTKTQTARHIYEGLLVWFNWIIWGGKTHLIARVHFLVAVHIKGHEGRKFLFSTCLSSFLPSRLIYPFPEPFFPPAGVRTYFIRIPMQTENSSSLEPPWDSCNELGLLRNLVLWKEQLLSRDSHCWTSWTTVCESV